MGKKNIYVIGPVADIEDDNKEAFLEVERELHAHGMSAFIPHDFVSPGTPHEQAMAESIRMLVNFYAVPWRPLTLDGVAMLDGWEDSDGARLEKAVAEACGMDCRPWKEWL